VKKNTSYLRLTNLSSYSLNKKKSKKGISFIVFILVGFGLVCSAFYLIKFVHFLIIEFLIIVPGIFAFTYYKFFLLWLLPKTIGDVPFQSHFKRYASKDENGNYTLYTKKAFCSFEGCKGIIELENAPEREKERYNLSVIGCCTNNLKTHTFTIDRDGVGHYKSMDFRPIKQQRSKN
jgi:hypothetical protein